MAECKEGKLVSQTKDWQGKNSISDTESGNVIDWRSSSWNTSSVENEEIEDLDELCQKLPEKSYFAFPEWRSFNEANELCTVLGILSFLNQTIKSSNCIFAGGKLIAPQNKKENDLVASIASKFNYTCKANEQGGKTMWIGVKPDDQGIWRVNQTIQKKSGFVTVSF